MKGDSSMSRVNRYSRRGRPANHPPVLCEETGKVFDTFAAAARSINGSRKCVMYCCYHMQHHHKGYHFRFVFN